MSDTTVPAAAVDPPALEVVPAAPVLVHAPTVEDRLDAIERMIHAHVTGVLHIAGDRIEAIERAVGIRHSA